MWIELSPNSALGCGPVLQMPSFPYFSRFGNAVWIEFCKNVDGLPRFSKFKVLFPSPLKKFRKLSSVIFMVASKYEFDFRSTEIAFLY